MKTFFNIYNVFEIITQHKNSLIDQFLFSISIFSECPKFLGRNENFQLYKISGQPKVARNSSRASWEKILLNLFEQKWKKIQPVLSARNLSGSLKFSNWRIFSKHPGKYFLRNSLESPIFWGQNGKKIPKLPNCFLHSLENPLM